MANKKEEQLKNEVYVTLVIPGVEITVNVRDEGSYLRAGYKRKEEVTEKPAAKKPADEK